MSSDLLAQIDACRLSPGDLSVAVHLNRDPASPILLPRRPVQYESSGRAFVFWEDTPELCLLGAWGSIWNPDRIIAMNPIACRVGYLKRGDTFVLGEPS